MKILYIAPGGGHMTEVLQLLWDDPNLYRSIVTNQQKIDEVTDINKYFNKRYVLPSIRPFNIIRIFRVILGVFVVLFKEKPNIIISAGHELSIPFFYIGKLLFRTKLVYVESTAQVFTLSLTGKIVYPLTNLFLVQWKYLKYKKAKYVGGLL
jgi:beta-1,4-N-acetylglucosaminyltransferase